VPGEEDRLLGVAAEAAHDDQVDPVGGGGAIHPVEGEGDVGAHRLALAVRERAVVAAARRDARRARPRRELGCGVGLDRQVTAGPRPRPRNPHVGLVAHSHADAHGRERRRVRKAHVSWNDRPTVLGGPTDSGCTGEIEVGGPVEVSRVRDARLEERRLEQARVVLAHRLRGGDRR
jgi:hypothetical protein